MEESIKIKKTEGEKSILETYAGDMTNYISTDKEGVVREIIHEERAREEAEYNQSLKSPVNKFLTFISFLLFFSAVGMLGYYYFFHKEDTVFSTSAPFKSLVINDNTVFLEIAGKKLDAIARDIAEQKRITKIKPGQLEGIYFTENKKVIGLSRWNAVTGSSLALGKTPVIGESFLLGIMSFEVKGDDASIENGQSSDVDPLRYAPTRPTRKDLFILLTANSFGEAFPVMRAWEGKMFLNLKDIFDIKPSADTEALRTRDWEDGIVQNKNARILYGVDGSVVLMYVYVDDRHVVITTTNDAVRETIERLAASKVSK